jgi:hypothetical protein
MTPAYSVTNTGYRIQPYVIKVSMIKWKENISFTSGKLRGQDKELAKHSNSV